MPPSARAPRWTRYVALGDSFTEGMSDPHPAAPGAYRGWADRLAESLAVRSDGPLEYANLAVRGRLLPQILAEQLPVALELRPDLVSLVGGGNDLLRPSGDPDTLAAALEDAVASLRALGADVLLATGVDPRLTPLIRRTRGKVAVMAASIWSIAVRQRAHVVDLWGMQALQDRRMWADDRLHLNAEGHRRVAEHALDALGVGAGGDWSTPLAAAPARPRLHVLREDARWVRGYVGPWVGRRLRGRSSGDAVTAKRPRPLPVPLPVPGVEPRPRR